MSSASNEKIKACVIQHKHRGSIHANLEYLVQQMKQLNSKQIDLVVLQELQANAYFCQSEFNANFRLAESLDGPTVSALSEIAKQHQMIIVSTVFEKRTAGIYHNTAVVLDKDGSLAGYYRKMHIPDDPGYYEKYYFTPGDHQPENHKGFYPIDTSIGKLGVLICWDQWYPEAARLMALAGAEILISPSAIGWDSNDNSQEQQRQLQAWQLIQRSHAVANGLHVIVSNRVGLECNGEHPNHNIDFWGHSFIAGPQGEILQASNGTEECNLVSEIDLRKTEQIRQTWPYLRDRRVDAYEHLKQRFID